MYDKQVYGYKRLKQVGGKARVSWSYGQQFSIVLGVQKGSLLASSIRIQGFKDSKDSRIQGFKIVNTLLYNNNSRKSEKKC